MDVVIIMGEYEAQAKLPLDESLTWGSGVPLQMPCVFVFHFKDQHPLQSSINIQHTLGAIIFPPGRKFLVRSPFLLRPPSFPCLSSSTSDQRHPCTHYLSTPLTPIVKDLYPPPSIKKDHPSFPSPPPCLSAQLPAKDMAGSSRNPTPARQSCPFYQLSQPALRFYDRHYESPVHRVSARY